MTALSDAEKITYNNLSQAPCIHCQGKIVVIQVGSLFKKELRLKCSNCNAIWTAKELELETQEWFLAQLRETKKLEEWPGPSPITLKRGEIVHMVSNIRANDVILCESRSHSYYVGGSHGFSLRIAKGVWLRQSGFGGSGQVTEERMTIIDKGRLVLTNSRLVFVGEKRLVSTDLQDIVNITSAIDPDEPTFGTIAIAKEGKVRIEAYTIFYAKIWDELIHRAMKALQTQPTPTNHEERKCRQCGVIPPSNAKFCPSCGAKLN